MSKLSYEPHDISTYQLDIREALVCLFLTDQHTITQNALNFPGILKTKKKHVPQKRLWVFVKNGSRYRWQTSVKINIKNVGPWANTFQTYDFWRSTQKLPSTLIRFE